jgi:hypothetical protein
LLAFSLLFVFFSLRQLQPIFCGLLRDDGSKLHDRRLLPFWHENRVCEHDVSWMVDMYVLLP